MNLEQLIEERRQFENNLYDFLLQDTMELIYIGIEEGYESYDETYDRDFWEPVKVSYTEIELLEDIIGEDTCTICTDPHLNFKKMKCCSQKMCNGCCYEWFENSVKCPYCYQDLRDF